MYRNFIFLDTTALNDYYSAVKGGLTTPPLSAECQNRL